MHHIIRRMQFQASRHIQFRNYSIQKPKKKMYVYNNNAQISKYFIEMNIGSMTTRHNLQFFS